MLKTQVYKMYYEILNIFKMFKILHVELDR